ncbi:MULTISPECIES: pyridoxal 5'-phosphate synthase [Pseudoalteromonas]|uniref:pyridoxine/pyridoxamine 5'-phosphate oxidase n=1 Tax=Pseudoalteromonas TaxID=53246 RepID=UPI001EF5E6E8|nr:MULTISPECIES: pyridoxal 5'-phosphate synthase [Pseudoalteromonas]MCG7539506.1 pyridoxal 5'-phosphate synthase [Pseudoalteromonas sp. OF7H-1]MCG9768503.1 pyridoxal 5'-phosphate synthase [Pseudoalteromonas piscicida]
MNNPIEKFTSWWQQALKNNPLNQPNAVCVSTIDENGFPTGRFVDLKAVNEGGFVFCSYFDSAKGKHLENVPNIAMTVWWDHVGYQVRIVGIAKKISDKDADTYWQGRSRDAQLTTTSFNQSAIIRDQSDLTEKLRIAELRYSTNPIPRPENWGGYCINPISIEFLTFAETRLHLRESYERSGEQWKKQLLQP